MLWLGVATFGIASLLSTNRLVRPLLVTGIGLALSAFVRPHIAGIWIAGLLPALLVALFRRRHGRSTGMALGLKRLGLVIAIGVAAVALSVVASATVKYLNPDGDEAEVDSTSITEILHETTRRTSEAGSTITPPKVASPLDWPVAAVRTLTRPLLIEARGTAQLLTALEASVFLVCCLGAYRRLLHIPKLLYTNPYIAFAMTSLFLGGLAYSSFANLGVLARQRSLVVPFMVLLPCLPPLPARGVSAGAGASDSTLTPVVA